ncbi:DUF2972 domain-containing protein [Helicobacter saguini]|uniref:DUF2972 domain-containing protein n=1 Tax=Helicobacter saguini TaxID=1548018 RepID=A0A4U8T4V3_9HELI|nr:DUF2972 domain-containing protein [Helicobacter saguini]MWV67793.1 DUF2972 domain-containing protein [Helicobacter saguini]MWV70739.1 DUF2972 domain-containing protein [Helicobacter saguini]MWV72642.1 DUF2972 domain-containing protein [Helicobacter saguini]TLD94551.1 DUF2972 domain-containing protein [Helicobacter saguini]
MDGKMRYTSQYDSLLKYDCLGLNIAEIGFPKCEKYISLLGVDNIVIYSVREPISFLKHAAGRDWSKSSKNFDKSPFNLTTDWRKYIQFLTPTKTDIKFDFSHLQNYGFLSNYVLSRLKYKKIIYIDMSEIMPDRAFSTMQKLAKEINLKTPKNSDIFKMKEFRGYIRYLVPLRFYASKSDLKNKFSLKNPHNKKK